jgi:hypothetical protein
MPIGLLPVPTATAVLAATQALLAVMAMPEQHAAMHQLLADTPEPHAVIAMVAAAVQEWPPAAACAVAVVCAVVAAAELAARKVHLPKYKYL